MIRYHVQLRSDESQPPRGAHRPIDSSFRSRRACLLTLGANGFVVRGRRSLDLLLGASSRRLGRIAIFRAQTLATGTTTFVPQLRLPLQLLVAQLVHPPLLPFRLAPLLHAVDDGEAGCDELSVRCQRRRLCSHSVARLTSAAMIDGDRSYTDQQCHITTMGGVESKQRRRCWRGKSLTSFPKPSPAPHLHAYWSSRSTSAIQRSSSKVSAQSFARPPARGHARYCEPHDVR